MQISVESLRRARVPEPRLHGLHRLTMADEQTHVEVPQLPRGHGALQPFRLRPWQRDIVKGLFPARGARPRSGLVSIPRGNGKSTLAAALGLCALYADDEEGAEVLVVASDERQARIMWNAARRMIELDDRLHVVGDCVGFGD